MQLLKTINSDSEFLNIELQCPSNITLGDHDRRIEWNLPVLPTVLLFTELREEEDVVTDEMTLTLANYDD